MKIDAIVYTSKAGHTKRYAELLGEKTGRPVLSLEEALKELPAGSNIVYLGWIHASHVQGFKKAEKKFILQCVLAVGLCDTGTMLDEVRKATGIVDTIPLFTLQGGMDRTGLKGMDKMMISMLAKGLASKEDRSQQDERMLELLSGDTDFVSEENLKGVLEYIV